MKERQELYCHQCEQYVQFDIEFDFDGNHEIKCPNCGHIHYRVVQDGKITDIRYRSSMQTFHATSVGTTSTSTFTLYSSGTGTTFDSGTATTAQFAYDSWLNTTTGTTS